MRFIISSYKKCKVKYIKAIDFTRMEQDNKFSTINGTNVRVRITYHILEEHEHMLQLAEKLLHEMRGVLLQII